MRAIVVLSLLLAACGSASPEMSEAEGSGGTPAPAAGTGGTGVAGGTGGAAVVAGTGGQSSAGSGGAMHDVGSGGMNGAEPMMQVDAGMMMGTGGSAGTAPDLEPYKASITVPNVASGAEGTVCVQVRLDNAMPINVVKLHNTLSTASHHFIVSKVTDPQSGEQANAPCQGFRAATKGEPLSISQKKDDVIVLPDGVAYALGASQVMNLELHYLNTASDAVDVTAQTELYPAEAGAQVQEATVMLIGTAQISIGPHMTASSGAKYAALPAGMDGAKFFAITGHTHRLGTSVKVSAASGPDDTGSLLYAPEPFMWDAPEMKHLDPAVDAPPGFSFECEWNNPSDDMIGFGESALDEMCFFWAYYYPKKPVAKGFIDGMDLGQILGRLP
jgi:hypothetical protein